MQRYLKRVVVVTMLGLASASASGAQPAIGSRSSIVAEQTEIRAEVLAKKNGWEAISEENRAKVIKNQDRVLQLLEGKQAASELNPGEQVEVINALEWIKAIAKDAEDERMVCKRERATGSNSLARVCKTVAQMRQERENAARTLNNSSLQNNQLAPTAGSP